MARQRLSWGGIRAVTDQLPEGIKERSGDGVMRKEKMMAVFVIERRFAEAIDLSEEDVRNINLINDEEDVQWLYSFLSVDRRKTYCLYEASSIESVRRAAVRAGLPADVVIEVCGKVHSDGSLNPV